MSTIRQQLTDRAMYSKDGDLMRRAAEQIDDLICAMSNAEDDIRKGYYGSALKALRDEISKAGGRK